jgi:hypothetical protein
MLKDCINFRILKILTLDADGAWNYVTKIFCAAQNPQFASMTSETMDEKEILDFHKNVVDAKCNVDCVCYKLVAYQHVEIDHPTRCKICAESSTLNKWDNERKTKHTFYTCCNDRCMMKGWIVPNGFAAKCGVYVMRKRAHGEGE